MKIIDCDSHIIPIGVYDNIDTNFKDRVPEYIFDSANRVTKISFAADPVNDDARPGAHNRHCELAGMSDISSRLNDLDKMKVNLQLLAPQERGLRFNYSVDKNLGATMAHSFNLSIKKIVDQYPDKFFGAALIPLQDIDLALQELRWAIDNGFKVIYMDYVYYNQEQQINKIWSTKHKMQEVYELCEANNIIIFIHFFMFNKRLLDIPEYATLISKTDVLDYIKLFFYDLLTSDLFDRFPRLQFVVTEKTQKVMYRIFENLTIAYNDRRELFKGTKSPLEYIKQHISFTIDIEMKDTFNFLLNTFGSKSLLFSTDYPHNDPSGLNKWKDTDDLINSGLSPDDIENIAFRNAEKLFKLN